MGRETRRLRASICRISRPTPTSPARASSFARADRPRRSWNACERRFAISPPRCRSLMSRPATRSPIAQWFANVSTPSSRPRSAPWRSVSPSSAFTDCSPSASPPAHANWACVWPSARRGRASCGWSVVKISLLVSGGLVVGLPLAFGASLLLRGLLFGIVESDVTTYAVAAAVLTAAGLTAGLGPARRAADIEPVTALRQE